MPVYDEHGFVRETGENRNQLSAMSADGMLRICQPDNYHGIDALPRSEIGPQAVRWATRTIKLLGPDWSKWHFTEGNCYFTACGLSVLAWEVDGSPQRDPNLDRVECKRCLGKMRAATQR